MLSGLWRAPSEEVKSAGAVCPLRNRMQPNQLFGASAGGKMKRYPLVAIALSIPALLYPRLAYAPPLPFLLPDTLVGMYLARSALARLCSWR